MAAASERLVVKAREGELTICKGRGENRQQPQGAALRGRCLGDVGEVWEGPREGVAEFGQVKWGRNKQAGSGGEPERRWKVKPKKNISDHGHSRSARGKEVEDTGREDAVTCGVPHGTSPGGAAPCAPCRRSPVMVG